LKEIENKEVHWPQNTIIEENGDLYFEVTLQGKQVKYTPEDVTAFMLQKMRETAESTFFLKKRIDFQPNKSNENIIKIKSKSLSWTSSSRSCNFNSKYYNRRRTTITFEGSFERLIEFFF